MKRAALLILCVWLAVWMGACGAGLVDAPSGETEWLDDTTTAVTTTSTTAATITTVSDAAASTTAGQAAGLSLPVADRTEGTPSAAVTRPHAPSSTVRTTTTVRGTTTRTTTSARATAGTTAVPRPALPGVMKACWVSQYDLNSVFRDGSRQRPQGEFTALAAQLFRNLRELGFNTAIVQARPFADSFYPSAFFPWSYIVTGTAGKTPAYDPLKILIDEAHRQGLAVHAWINPIRAMTTKQMDLIADTYLIKTWYNDPAARGTKIVEVGDRWYLNPAYPDVRQLILDGAAELLRLYPVEGLHMDDRFYPTTAASFDAAAYAESGAGRSLTQFRLDNFNTLVKGLYDRAHAAGVVYGVSPDANISSNYSKHYADVRTWCREAGYIDYICPQIYYGMEHQGHPFAKTAQEWNDLITAPGVSLVAGMSLGKTISEYDQWAGTGAYEWKEHKDILSRCMATLPGLSRFAGVSLFCYQYLYDPVTGVARADTQQEVQQFLPVLRALDRT